MITMENVLKRGRTAWDRSLLPEDEYVERLRGVRSAAKAAELDVVVLIGHSTHYGNFTYLSGCVPALGWMALVVGQESDPVLVSGGGSRDLPFLRTVTWLTDIRTSSSLFAGPAEVVGGVVGELAAPGASVGLVGASGDLDPVAYLELRSVLGRTFRVADTDDLLSGLREVKRPREKIALARSLEIARSAVGAAVLAWQEGASTSSALIKAEYTAHMNGARDVRVLGNLGGEALRPVEEYSAERADRLVVHCSVEYLGYWSRVCTTVPMVEETNAARRAVEAMVRAAGPGVSTAEVVDAATQKLPAGTGDVAFAYGLGGGVGLDITEWPILLSNSGNMLKPGTVVGFQVVTIDGGALVAASQTVLVDEMGVNPQ